MAQIITSTLTIEEMYERFALETKKLVDFDRMTVNLVDEEAAAYTLKHIYGTQRASRLLGSVVPLAGNQNEQVLALGGTLIREDTANTSEHISYRDGAKEKMHASVMVLLISKGRAIGTLGLRSRHAGAFGPRE